jgi:glycosyltransferase involved in cell wall biosynthesis
MKIVVNTRLLIKNKLEGIGWFTFETMRRIAAWHPEHSFIFLFDRQPSEEFLFSSNIKPVVLKPQARHPLLWYIWFEFSVARYLKNNPADLFLSPDGFIPLNSNIPSIAVIHDINFYHFPKGIPILTRFYYNLFFPKFARRATKVVTVSHYSKNDIASNFKVLPEKIIVTHNGANECYVPLNNEEKDKVIREYSDGKPYFVFVGALNPRKNVARLIKAFDLFLNDSGLDYHLLIVGEPMFMTNDIKVSLDSITNKNSVIFTGRLQVEALRYVVGAAVALAYTPYFEGFGIPMVEAMYCHVPIIASNRTSMPEVAGDAAYYVDPFDVNSIAKALIEVATNDNLRESLSKKAEERKKLFSWNYTAENLYKCIVNVVAKAKD